jgi:hypothetical protein
MNFDKQQKQDLNWFQIYTVEKFLSQSKCEKVKFFWFNFCFSKAEAGFKSKSKTKHIGNIWKTRISICFEEKRIKAPIEILLIFVLYNF